MSEVIKISKFEAKLQEKLEESGISPFYLSLLNEEGSVLDQSVNKVYSILKKHVEKDVPRQSIRITLKDGRKKVLVGLLRYDFPGSLAEAKDRLIHEGYKLLESRFLTLLAKQKGKEILNQVTFVVSLGDLHSEKDYFFRLGKRWVGEEKPIFKLQHMLKKSPAKGTHVLVKLS